ncbi:hypothetical protein [Methylomonas koyamae]|uniref:hypothetical protein n=1 Tax=Methylomonas koyamae TaxID=702114 RepID=UPI00112A69B1|nr:hypothetical protein [Methylomonas koyamae]TPQ25103.1 hypothetical protein C2U68_16670 [Methylomonas koyamae]
MIKKIFIIICLTVSIYFISVFARAYNSERIAENYIKEALFDFANPWRVESLNKRASWWLINKSDLSPDDICRLANVDLGNIIKIIKNPECNLQQGFDKFSAEKHTYALCSTIVKFEKNSVDIKIRLIDENGGWKAGDWKINDFMSINKVKE